MGSQMRVEGHAEFLSASRRPWLSRNAWRAEGGRLWQGARWKLCRGCDPGLNEAGLEKVIGCSNEVESTRVSDPACARDPFSVKNSHHAELKVRSSYCSLLDHSQCCSRISGEEF